MEKRILGGSLEVSALGLGCMGLSHAYGEPVEEEEAVRTIRYAQSIGYSFFDTAEVYVGTFADGRMSINERLVGRALAPVRHSVQIATKFGIRINADRSLTPDGRPEAIRASVEQSLKRLGTDYIDLYYQHRTDPEVDPETVAGVMSDLMKEGKILHWGICECTEDYLVRADRICHVTAVQDRYSMMARWNESVFPLLEKLDIGFVAFSPLANGFLTSSHDFNKSDSKDYRTAMPQYTEEGTQKGRRLMLLLEDLAAQKGCTVASLSLAWMLCKKPYIVPIPGSRKPERIAENAEAVNIRLSDDEVASVDRALADMDFLVYGGAKVRP